MCVCVSKAKKYLSADMLESRCRRGQYDARAHGKEVEHKRARNVLYNMYTDLPKDAMHFCEFIITPRWYVLSQNSQYVIP